MNPYASTLCDTTHKAVVRSQHLGTFIIFNALAALIFPCFCFIAVIVFWSNNTLFAAAIGTYAISHMLVLWYGLCRRGHAVRIALPALWRDDRHFDVQPPLDWSTRL